MDPATIAAIISAVSALAGAYSQSRNRMAAANQNRQQAGNYMGPTPAQQILEAMGATDTSGENRATTPYQQALQNASRPSTSMRMSDMLSLAPSAESQQYKAEKAPGIAGNSISQQEAEDAWLAQANNQNEAGQQNYDETSGRDSNTLEWAKLAADTGSAIAQEMIPRPGPTGGPRGPAPDVTIPGSQELLARLLARLYQRR
jgi:hypothetical protein